MSVSPTARYDPSVDMEGGGWHRDMQVKKRSLHCLHLCHSLLNMQVPPPGTPNQRISLSVLHELVC